MVGENRYLPTVRYLEGIMCGGGMELENCPLSVTVFSG